MKKLICIALAITCLMSLTACGKTEAQSDSVEAEPTIKNEEMALSELKQGDEVSIVGQVAAYSLENGNTLWVQVLRQGERTVVYHCQMKEEYIADAEALNIMETAKVTGKFLNLVDMANEPEVSLEAENIAIIVTLYDCVLTD